MYKHEFPDYDGEFFCPEGWGDYSYHNDVCPRALCRIESKISTVDFSIWQDYVDVNKREYDNGKRYLFQIHVNNDLIYHYETDDLKEIKRLAEGVQSYEVHG